MADEYIDKVEVGAKIQMMYIRREMDYGGENDFCRGMRKALRIIENIPAADVQPVRHGRWLLKFDGDIYEYRECSKCGNTGSCETPYCAQCGARMDGDTDE